MHVTNVLPTAVQSVHTLMCVACTHPASCPAVSVRACVRPLPAGQSLTDPCSPGTRHRRLCGLRHIRQVSVFVSMLVCVFAGVMVSVFVSMFVSVFVRVLLVILKECSSVCVLFSVLVSAFVNVLVSVSVWAFVSVLASVSVGVCVCWSACCSCGSCLLAASLSPVFCDQCRCQVGAEGCSGWFAAGPAGGGCGYRRLALLPCPGCLQASRRHLPAGACPAKLRGESISAVSAVSA